MLHLLRILYACLALLPQTTPLALKDECGDPLTVSQAYISLEGTAIEVKDGATFTIRLDNGRRKEVHLIALNAPALTAPLGPESRQHLSSLISGKRVTISFSPYGE